MEKCAADDYTAHRYASRRVASFIASAEHFSTAKDSAHNFLVQFLRLIIKSCMCYKNTIEMFHTEAFSKSYSRQDETRNAKFSSRLVLISKHGKPRKLKLRIVTVLRKSCTKKIVR